MGRDVHSPYSDIDELGAAFKLLGFKLTRREMLELMEEVDADGGGEQLVVDQEGNDKHDQEGMQSSNAFSKSRAEMWTRAVSGV